MDLSAITQYLSTGQIAATANGLLGSAEYEFLSGRLGLAFGQTLSVSFGVIYFTILIVLGNIFYFIHRGEAKPTIPSVPKEVPKTDNKGGEKQ
jgi:hypothetical protein